MGTNKRSSDERVDGRTTCELEPDATMATGFEDEPFDAAFTGGRIESNFDRVSEPTFDGQFALRVRFEGDDHYGGSLDYAFADAGEPEPEELYARFALRFGESWRPDRTGKLPGFGGTYGRAGWGGRPVSGEEGWSARGRWAETANPGETRVGYYVYHADMEGPYGDDFLDEQSPELIEAATLRHERWYCVEQYVRLNTPGKADGVLRLWVDDRLAYEKTDLRFRDTAALKIERYWANFYYGGSWTPPDDMYVYLDNLVLSADVDRLGRRR